MEKDLRYKSVKVMIETGNIIKFSQIFDILPKSVMAHDMGLHNSRITRLIENPGSFSIEELVQIARLADTDPELIIKLAFNDYILKSRSKTKK